MNPNDRNNDLLHSVVSNIAPNHSENSSFDITRYYPSIAATGAALAGGALYYILNFMGKNKNNNNPLIDFKNQTREIKVKI